MQTSILNRRLHYWVSMVITIPLLVMIASGLLLQIKKQSDWVQPPEQRGSGTIPSLAWNEMLSSLRRHQSIGVETWTDVNRIDVRPAKGIAKVWLHSGWEAQLDIATGEILQVAYRRSDTIESIHDGSFFAGDWTKLGLFLPAGLALLFLWASGIWMLWQPFAAKRRQRAKLAARAIVMESAD